MNPKTPNPRQIVIKIPNFKDIEKILKEVGRNKKKQTREFK